MMKRPQIRQRTHWGCDRTREDKESNSKKKEYEEIYPESNCKNEDKRNMPMEM
jgi:hypothetical protein